MSNAESRGPVIVGTGPDGKYGVVVANEDGTATTIPLDEVLRDEGGADGSIRALARKPGDSALRLRARRVRPRSEHGVSRRTRRPHTSTGRDSVSDTTWDRCYGCRDKAFACDYCASQEGAASAGTSPETPTAAEVSDEGCVSDECDGLRMRMAELLTRTANALKGEPEPLKSHSWHDLPEVAASTVEQAVRHGRLAKEWETACLAADKQLRDGNKSGVLPVAPSPAVATTSLASPLLREELDAAYGKLEPRHVGLCDTMPDHAPCTCGVTEQRILLRRLVATARAYHDGMDLIRAAAEAARALETQRSGLPHGDEK